MKHHMLPEYLQGVGYNTHMVGKWHLGFFMDEYLPTNRGFESFYGFLTDQENYYDRQYPYPIGGDDLYFKDWMDLDVTRSGDYGYTHRYGNYSLDLIMERSKEIISRSPSLQHYRSDN